MEHIKKTMPCPKCGKVMKKLDKFCPKCGQRIGNGVRSPGEMRALIARIKRHVPDINDAETAQWYLSVMATTMATLSWALGEMDKDVLEMAQEKLAKDGGKDNGEE